MAGHFDDPEHWLKLARDSRVSAEWITDAYSKRTLLLIAQRYEMMAERAKRRSDEGRKDECASA